MTAINVMIRVSDGTFLGVNHRQATGRTNGSRRTAGDALGRQKLGIFSIGITPRLHPPLADCFAVHQLAARIAFVPVIGPVKELLFCQRGAFEVGVADKIFQPLDLVAKLCGGVVDLVRD